MDRRSRIVLLAVLGAGVFLAGLELMVTAVALPSIVTDLASWTELRLASWVINGYLLAYVITMPLAGRLAGLHSVSINQSYRITLELLIRDRQVIPVNLGDHDAVY